MKGLRFSLIQLIVCVGLILFIAFILIKSNTKPQVSKSVVIPEPQVTIPFQDIKLGN